MNTIFSEMHDDYTELSPVEAMAYSEGGTGFLSDHNSTTNLSSHSNLSGLGFSWGDILKPIIDIGISRDAAERQAQIARELAKKQKQIAAAELKASQVALETARLLDPARFKGTVEGTARATQQYLLYGGLGLGALALLMMLMKKKR